MTDLNKLEVIGQFKYEQDSKRFHRFRIETDSGITGSIYIPKNKNDINLANPNQWNALNAFIEQDKYLSSHRGQIAERFGVSNPWFSNIDLRVLQDFSLDLSGRKHTFQIDGQTD